MEPDISTLHNPDILTLRRQGFHNSLTCLLVQTKMRAKTVASDDWPDISRRGPSRRGPYAG